jgi:hypothetical protein
MILFYIKYRNDKKSKFDNAIMILYRQTARWAAASIQDDSELIRLLHANYSAGYLWSLKDIVSTEEFKRITGEDFLTLESKIVSIQDTATKMIVDKCKPLIFVEEPLLFKAMYSRKNE